MIVSTEHRRGAVWLGVAVVVAATAAIAPKVSLLPAAVLIILMTWRWTDTALTYSAIIVLALRPATDIFSNSRDPTASTALRPSPVIGLLVLLIAAVVAVRRLRLRRPVWPVPALRRIHYWLFAAYGIALLSGAAGYGSEGLFVGIRELVRMGSTIAALLLILWWVEDHPERYRTGWMLLFLGTLPPLAVATWQWVTGQGYAETEGLNRLYGTFSHPHSLGPYLIPFVLFATGGYLAASQRGRILRLLLIAFFTLILTLTYSRTALLVLAAALGFLALLLARRFGLRALAAMPVPVLVAAAVIGAVLGQSVRARFATISVDPEVMEAALAGQSENSFTWRILNWGTLVRMGMEEPLIGHGAAMTTVLNPLTNIEYGGKPFNAHDDFVRWFFEAGALGVICYVVYGVLLCQWVLRKASSASRSAAGGAYGAGAALVAIMFLSLGTVEYSSQTAILFQFSGILGFMSVLPGDTLDHSVNSNPPVSMTAPPA